MKKYRVYLIFFALLIAISCSNKRLDKYNPLSMQISQEDKIKLLKEIRGRKLVIENCYAIISLPMDTVIKYINIDLKYFGPCAKREAFYAEFLKELKNFEDDSFYFIQNDITSKDENYGLLYLDSIKYPDQYKLRNNFRSNKIGKNGEYVFDIQSDTNSLRKISEMPGRILGRILKSGSATVFNKITGKFEDSVLMQATIEKISRYRLLFKSRIPFLKQQIMLDNIDPNNDCGEKIGNLD